MTCPPCHGACNQGRTCPHLQMSASQLLLRIIFLGLVALTVFLGMFSAAVILVVAG